MEHLDFQNLNGYRTREAIIVDLKSDGLPVAIYGAGQIGKEVAAVLMANQIEVLCFLETQEYLWPGKSIEICGNNIICIEVDELSRHYSDYNIVLGVIENILLPTLREKFPAVHYIEYLDVHPSHRMEYGFLTENRLIIEEIYEVLADQESKDVFEAYLHARYTGDITSISSLARNDGHMYDWGLLNVSANDVIVDGGAYVGDTVLEIFEYLEKYPKHIFAFEPDSINLEQLMKNVASTAEEEVVTVVNAGLFDSDTILRFSGGGNIGSTVLADGSEEIRVISLDRHEEYKDVTIIKLDIEGSELNALKGAERLIAKNHPKIAVCIYHNNEDVIDLYKLLKEYHYRFYLRQHSHSSEETVLYAL